MPSPFSMVGADDEREPVPPDLQLVAVAEHRLVGALTVDVRTVQRSDVTHHVARVGAVEGHVAP